MRHRPAVWLLAFACAIPGTAPGGASAEGEGWVPALAAFGEVLAPAAGVPMTRSVQLVAIPVLGAMADASAGAIGDPRSGVAATDLPVPEARDPEARDETQRWVPGFGFSSGVFAQNAEGSVTSSNVRYTLTSFPVGLPPQFPPFTRVVSEPLSPSASGDDLFVTPFVGLSTEMMTPGLQGVPGRPRLFVHGDVSISFSATRFVAKDGVPESGLAIPPDLATSPPGDAQPGTLGAQIDGQGSSTTGTVKTLVVSAGLGSAFTISVGERWLRIKPSVEYFREEIEVEGLVARLIQTNQGSGSRNPPVNPHFVYPTPILEGSVTKTYYGIGPGLEVEMDAARAGPFMLSLFTSGQAYRMLGDRDIEFEDSTTMNDPALNPNPQTASAKWTFHPHAWTYRGGVGLRFRWLPED